MRNSYNLYPKINLLIFSLIICFSCKENTAEVASPDTIKSDIMTVIMDQQEAWNEGNIDRFMEGYWNNQDLSFSGKSGVTKGWQNTLVRYKESYPDKAAMGVLTFTISEIRIISETVATLNGQFELERENDKPSGYFTLVWEKIDGKWLITSDHTSS